MHTTFFLVVLAAGIFRDHRIGHSSTSTRGSAKACPKLDAFDVAWKKRGVEVVKYASLDAFRNRFVTAPWKDTFYQRGTKEDDTPSCDGLSCQATGIADILRTHSDEPLYLYHGGNIKVAWFGSGIDFEKTMDRITGHAFFTTHNPMFASYYGSKGITNSEGFPLGDPSDNCEMYRQVLQLEVKSPKTCRGIVPSMEFLQGLADIPLDAKDAFIQKHCGEQCSFLAINWEKNLPYEFRILPDGLEACGIEFARVLLIKHSNNDPDNVMPDLRKEQQGPFFSKLGDYMEAGNLFGKLMERHTDNYERANHVF